MVFEPLTVCRKFYLDYFQIEILNHSFSFTALILYNEKECRLFPS